MLHIVNGDSAARDLMAAGIAGEVAVWAEILHEGPILLDATDEEWRSVRAHFYAGCGWGSVGANLERLEGWDAAIGRLRDHDEVVIWTEIDLFDQLLLIRHLSRFKR